MYRQPTLKRSASAQPFIAPRYALKRTKRIPLQPKRYTSITSNKTEVKNSFGNTGDVTVTSDGVLRTYGGVEQGSDDHERIGSEITQLYQTLNIRLERAPGVPHSTCRIIFGIWKLPLNSPTVADILDDDGTSRVILWPLSTETSSNYQILGDEYVNLPAVASGQDISTDPIIPLGTVTYMKRKFRYKRSQQYSGSGETSFRNWTHFVLLVSDTDQCSFDLGWNVFYTDN